MPKVTGTYPHTLDMESARGKMREALDDLLESFEMKDVERNEDGNTTTFKGVSRGVNTGGSIEISESDVKVVIQLPFRQVAIQVALQKAIDKRVPPFLG